MSAEKKGLKILWVPVSASNYEETDLAKYQAVLNPARPLDRLSSAEQNAALVDICREIKRARDS